MIKVKAFNQVHKYFDCYVINDIKSFIIIDFDFNMLQVKSVHKTFFLLAFILKRQHNLFYLIQK